MHTIQKEILLTAFAVYVGWLIFTLIWTTFYLIDLKNLLTLVIIVSCLYGTSYQQFRHFDTSDPRGLSDSHSYIEMSHGNYEVKDIHKFRPLIPIMAGALQKVLNTVIRDQNEADKLSFYMVNFGIVSLTAFLLYLILSHFGFRYEMAMMGVFFFLSSRIVVISTATPIVDSLYYLAIAGLVFLVEKRKLVHLSWLLPVMVLSKETFLPFLFLPLFIADFRKPTYALGIALAIVASIGIRVLIDSSTPSQSSGLIDIVLGHANNIIGKIRGTFSLSGLHDWQNGFSFILVLSILGFRRDALAGKRSVPGYLLFIIPISIFYGLLSGNFGRMLFTAFIPIYAYALIFIDSIIRRSQKSNNLS